MSFTVQSWWKKDVTSLLTPWSSVFLALIHRYVPGIWATVGADNGLGPTFVSEPMLTYPRLVPRDQTSVKFEPNDSTYIFKIIRLKMPSAKMRPYWSGLKVSRCSLIHLTDTNWNETLANDTNQSWASLHSTLLNVHSSFLDCHTVLGWWL